MEKLMIIDGNGLMYRGFYAMPPLSNSKGLYTNAVYGFVNLLINALTTYKPNYLVVAFDFSKKTFRNKIYENYKATRKPTPNELIGQFPIIKDLLKTMGVCVIEKEGIEADDIIATITKKALGIEKIIITGDRDSFQLIDSETNVYLTKKGISEIKVIDEKVLKDEYGITPSQVVDLKALMGDASDNIPGVSGVGEKTAVSLISTYGTLDGVYEHIDEIKGALALKLANDKQNAYLSQKLALNVVDDALNIDLNSFAFTLPFNIKTKEKFKDLEFKSLLKKEGLFEKTEPKVVKNVQKIENLSQLNEFLNKIKQSKVVAFDFENDILNITNGEDVVFVNTEFSLLKSELSFSEVALRLKDIINDESIKKIVFDLKLNMHKFKDFDIVFKNVCDVALAKYLLDSTLSDYTVRDLCVELGTSNVALAIYEFYLKMSDELEKYGLTKLYNEIELPLVYVLYKMETDGVKIDTNILKQYDDKVSKEISEVENEIYKLAGHSFNIKSPKQVGEVLFGELKLKSGKQKSTNVDVLNELVNLHPIVPLILKHRKIVKLKNTYIDSYFKYEQNGFIHASFNQMVTDTGRLSCANPNLQNIPVKDDEAKFIREVFVSRFEGGQIISFDYSQIELKLMAHYSCDPLLVKAFNEGRDIHTATASLIYGVSEDDVAKSQRRVAKTVNFGIIYGQGSFGLSQQLGISLKEANDFITTYFKTFPKVKEYMQNSITKAVNNDYTATTLFGRRRKIQELALENKRLKAFGERVAMNMPLQGSASDIIKMAMIKASRFIQDNNLKTKLVLQIHDELVFDVPKEEVDIVKQSIKDIMENVVKLNVPINVSINQGDNLLK